MRTVLVIIADRIHRVTDIAPRTKGHMHAINSLDFLIVHKGNVTLHLDSGEKQLVREGEVIGTLQHESLVDEYSTTRRSPRMGE
jgi:hypothetical protein